MTDSYHDVIGAFDRLAAEEDRWRERTAPYHELITSIHRGIVPPGARVLEIGCGSGDLLAAVEPARGVGVDVSAGMIEAARRRHPSLEFHEAAGESLDLGERFDYVILSDVVPYVADLQRLFEVVREHLTDDGRVVAHTYSLAWRPLLRLLAALRLRARKPIRNWVAPRDVVGLFGLAGIEPVLQRTEILVPMRRSGVSRIVNGVFAHLPGVRALCLTSWLVGRVARRRAESGVSVIVPCRNEAGSIAAIAERVPDMGMATEIVFVEGHSRDDTRTRIEQAIAAHPERDMRLVVQSGKGKGNAVREGFAIAKHEVLMILDGDLTVAPEDLVKFYDALVNGRGDVINGTRLVYGMDRQAMRFLNLLGNKFFASLLSFVLGQYVKDTLCGTKVLTRDTWERIRARRHEFLAEDPYGDFDLLLGASLLGLKIIDVPVRYGARIYGAPNISRLSEGPMLLRLALAGYDRLWMRPVGR